VVFVRDPEAREDLRLMVLDFAARVGREARAKGSDREHLEGLAVHRLKALGHSDPPPGN
jgi:hypothetical protein